MPSAEYVFMSELESAKASSLPAARRARELAARLRFYAARIEADDDAERLTAIVERMEIAAHGRAPRKGALERVAMEYLIAAIEQEAQTRAALKKRGVELKRLTRSRALLAELAARYPVLDDVRAKDVNEAIEAWITVDGRPLGAGADDRIGGGRDEKHEALRPILGALEIDMEPESFLNDLARVKTRRRKQKR